MSGIPDPRHLPVDARYNPIYGYDWATDALKVTTVLGGESGGATVTLAYDGSGRLDTVTTAEGGQTKVETLVYDGSGRLSTVSVSVT